MKTNIETLAPVSLTVDRLLADVSTGGGREVSTFTANSQPVVGLPFDELAARLRCGRIGLRPHRVAALDLLTEHGFWLRHTPFVFMCVRADYFGAAHLQWTTAELLHASRALRASRANLEVLGYAVMLATGACQPAVARIARPRHRRYRRLIGQAITDALRGQEGGTKAADPPAEPHAVALVHEIARLARRPGVTLDERAGHDRVQTREGGGPR